MTQIGAPLAPTIVPASAHGAGAEAQITAELDATANAGDPISEFRLGILYALPTIGVGAASLLRASAESGRAEVQCDCGMRCDKGPGVARDASEAARW